MSALVPEIIYEDADVLVLNKPAGLTVHPDDFTPPTPGPFLTDWLVKNYPAVKSVGEDSDRPGIVHRLDKETSGVMVVAKTQPAFTWLKKQFKDHLVEKTYLALLTGEVKMAVGEEKIISSPIGRSGQDPRVRVASAKAYGKLRPAETKFKIAEHLCDFTLVEAFPKTGRTHQLRAHFKAYQHPIACDILYGTGNLCPPGMSRLALHASRLALTLPGGERAAWAAALPGDFTVALAQLRRAC